MYTTGRLVQKTSERNEAWNYFSSFKKFRARNWAQFLSPRSCYSLISTLRSTRCFRDSVKPKRSLNRNFIFLRACADSDTCIHVHLLVYGVVTSRWTTVLGASATKRSLGFGSSLLSWEAGYFRRGIIRADFFQVLSRFAGRLGNIYAPLPLENYGQSKLCVVHRWGMRRHMMPLYKCFWPSLFLYPLCGATLVKHSHPSEP